MAGSLSDFSENEILDLAVFTAAPTDAGGGTEVTGGSYARLAVTNDATNFPAAVAGAKSNGVALTMVTASASWGTIVAYALFDASSAGNMIGWADLTSSVLINNGDTLRFAAGALTYSLT